MPIGDLAVGQRDFSYSGLENSRSLELELNVLPVDFVGVENGARVVLIHSSVSGARQWRRLMSELESRFQFVAINLLGYGQTQAWAHDRPQSLDDQATLIETVLPNDGSKVCLAGHSFGGSVAMKAAARLGDRVDKLVLLEPNLFCLLDLHGCAESYTEIIDFRLRKSSVLMNRLRKTPVATV